MLDESNRKPNKTWIDKGIGFKNRSIKSWLENSAIEIYSTHNDEKSVIAQRLIRTLKNKVCKYIISISTNVNKLDDIANKYSNKYHSAIKMKPVNVTPKKNINSSKKLMIKIGNLKLVILLE